MKAKRTTKAVTKEVTKEVIVAMKGEEDVEVDDSMLVTSRQEEKVVTRTDVEVANITTLVPSARLKVRNMRWWQLSQT